MADDLGSISDPSLADGSNKDFRPSAESIYPTVAAVEKFCTIFDPRTRSKVPIFLATAERPYAVQLAEIVREGRVFPPGALPLPAMALTFLEMTPDPARQHSFYFRNLAYTDDKNDVWQALYPKPFNYLFQLDIRSKFQTEIWRLCELHSNKFYTDLATLPAIDMGPFGLQEHVVIQTSGARDASELDPGDDRERSLRKTYTLTVYGWLVSDAWRRRTMRSVTLSLQDAVDDTVLGTATTPPPVD